MFESYNEHENLSKGITGQRIGRGPKDQVTVLCCISICSNDVQIWYTNKKGKEA